MYKRNARVSSVLKKNSHFSTSIEDIPALRNVRFNDHL